MECHECGATISEKAADCPRCGTSVRDVSEGGEPVEPGTAAGNAGDTRPADDDAAQPADSGGGRDAPTAPGSSADDGESDETDPGEAETTLVDTGDERDADPVDRETTLDGAVSPGESDVRAGGQAEDTRDPEPSTGRESSAGGRSVSGTGVDAGGHSAETVEPVGSGDDATTGASSEGIDLAAQVRGLPLLTAPLAGVVTAAVVTVLSVIVGVLVPDTGFDPVTVGGLVVMDLHFATSRHVTTGILTQFDTARPPDSVLGILYLLPPLFLYTASKFVAAYNTDESTLTPMAGVGGALVAVGYFPATLVALFLAPGGPLSPVSLLPAVLLAGIAYPVFFGFVGGLAGGALSGSERRVGTLYGVVAFFMVAVGAFALTIPSVQVPDVGIIPQIHASLFTVLAVNGFSLGGADVGFLVLLAYPFVALVVFAAGFLRAWNAGDVAGPLRGLAKGLSPAVTYFTLLGLLGTVLPLLADPWVVGELGLSAPEVALVQRSIRTEFYEVGRYVTVVFVGTLVYAVFLGGIGGTVAGTARYVLSDSE